MASFSQDNPQLAATYDRLSDSQFEAGKALLGRLELKAGERVLDVGCGTGRLAAWAAERVGAEGSVVGIDPLADRIALAKNNYPQLRFEVAQAENLSLFDDHSFDLVCLAAVFHWIAEKPKAFAEIARVLKKGGRMGLTTMPKELHRAGTIAKTCGTFFGRAQWAEKSSLEAFSSVHQSLSITELVEMTIASGLELEGLHVVRRTHSFQSGLDVVDHVESSSFGNFLGRIPEAHRETLRQNLAKEFESKRGTNGIEIRMYGMMLLASRT